MLLRKRKGIYTGAVVFVDGVHYPIRKGRPYMKQKLLWNGDAYEYWDGKGTDHLGRYHQRELELPLGAE